MMFLASERLLLTDAQWALLDAMRQRGPLHREALQDEMRRRLLRTNDLDVELEALRTMRLAHCMDRRWRLTLRGRRCVVSRRCAVPPDAHDSGAARRDRPSLASVAWLVGAVLVLLLIWIALNSHA